MKEISKNRFYTEFDSDGMGDLYTYGEVMNNHFVSREWVGGVALVEMTYGCWAIFNGYNDRVYIIYEDNVPNGWIKEQFKKCALKFIGSNAGGDFIRVSNEAEVQKIIDEQRAMDY